MLNDPFQPRPSEIHLMFTCEASGNLKDLRSGIRTFMTNWYHADTAWRMAIAPTFNWVVSRDRSKRCIMLTADGSAAVASVLLDLYARLLNMGSTIRTLRASYTATMDGTLDLQRVNAINTHFMYLSEFFDRDGVSREERHHLN